MSAAETEVPAGWILAFPPPAPLMNLNQRRHWSAAHPDKVAWRDAAFYHAREAINSKIIPGNLSQIAVIFDFPVASTKVRRDAHNYTPTVKASIDGLVKAGMFIDDSTDHLTVDDSWFHARRDNPHVIIHIRKRTP